MNTTDSVIGPFSVFISKLTSEMGTASPNPPPPQCPSRAWAVEGIKQFLAANIGQLYYFIYIQINAIPAK